MDKNTLINKNKYENIINKQQEKNSEIEENELENNIKIKNDVKIDKLLIKEQNSNAEVIKKDEIKNDLSTKILKRNKKKKTELTDKQAKHKSILEFVLYCLSFLLIEVVSMASLGYTMSIVFLVMFFITNCFFFALINLIKKWKIRFTMYTIHIIANTLLGLGNIIYIAHKKDGISSAMIKEAVIGLTFFNSEASSSYGPMSVWNKPIFIAIILSIIGLIVGLFFVTRHNTRKVQPKAYKTLIISSIVTFMAAYPIYVTNFDAYANSCYDKFYSTQNIGVLNYFVQDFSNLLYRNAVTKNKVVYVEPETPEVSSTDAITGTFEGCNVIQIMLEEVEGFLFSEELTPNIYNLMNNGINYSNFYTSFSYLSTYDAEFKSLTSSMAYTANNYYIAYSDNTFNNSLPHVLGEKGYKTIGMHNFQGGFFNREKIWDDMDFQETYFVDDMTYDNYYDHRSDWYETWPYPDFPPDSIMFEDMTDTYAPTDLDQPFYSFIMPVASHQPYNNHKQILDDMGYYDTVAQYPKYDNYPDSFKNDLVTAMDLDKGIGSMMQHLTENNMLDNTIIVMYTDHHSYNNEEEFEGFRQPCETPYDIFRVPCMIYNPKLTPNADNQLFTSQYDIVPTIFDMLGVQYKTDYYYGQSMFDENRDSRPLIFGAYKWQDDIMYARNFKSHTYNDNELSDEENKLHYEETSKYVWDTIQKFNYFMYSDYFNSEITTYIE